MTKQEQQNPKAAENKLDGGTKLAVELGPLAAFFIGFFGHGALAPIVDKLLGVSFFVGEGRELYLAVLFSLPAFAAAFVISLVKVRRIAPMLLISGIIVMVLGALTFIFQSKTFVYMKPTIIYLATAATLAGGLISGRIFLKMLFDGAIEMDEGPWRVLTWRFVGINVFSAIANEFFWRTLTAGCLPDAECAGEATWVNIKIFGFTGMHFLFVFANMPFLMKHMKENDQKVS